MRLNKIAGQFSADYRPPPPSHFPTGGNKSAQLLYHQSVFFTAKDIIISFGACSCMIDYFILLSQYREVQYFILSTGTYGEVGFPWSAPGSGRVACCKWSETWLSPGLSSKSSNIHAHIFSFAGDIYMCSALSSGA